MVRAILRAQILSMRLRVGTRRAGAIFGVVGSFIFYTFWAFFALGIAAYFSNPNLTGTFLPALSTGLRSQANGKPLRRRVDQKAIADARSRSSITLASVNSRSSRSRTSVRVATKSMRDGMTRRLTHQRLPKTYTIWSC